MLQGKRPDLPWIQSQNPLFFIDSEQGMKHSSIFYLFEADIDALALDLQPCFSKVHRESAYEGTYS